MRNLLMTAIFGALLLLLALPASAQRACSIERASDSSAGLEWRLIVQAGERCGNTVSGIGTVNGMRVASAPAHGRVEVDRDRWAYVAEEGYVGRDEFTISWALTQTRGAAGIVLIQNRRFEVIVAAGGRMQPFRGDSTGSQGYNIQATGPDSGLPQLDQFMMSVISRYGAHGGALAVSRNGQVIYARGFGRDDRDRAISVTDQLLVASLSKPVAAMATMLLVQQGRLRLDSTIGEVLGTRLTRTGRPADPRILTISVQQLLMHRGGFEELGTPETPERGVLGPVVLQLGPSADRMTFEEIGEAIIRRETLESQPGQVYRYSNLNFFFLGLMIKTITGQPYGEFVQSQVFLPIGVRASYVGPEWTSRLLKKSPWLRQEAGFVAVVI
jgi:CubicO group peptidase (beta-lactamase class C family)